MYAVLRDEQTLCDFINGMNLKVISKETFICEGFYYNVFQLEQDPLHKTKFYIVTKVLDSGAFDTYVCFVPDDFTEGSREENSWLFAEDGMYIASIFNQDDEYAGIHSVSCTVETPDGPVRPAFVTEYETNVKVDNPRVFVLETIDDRDGDSYIVLLQGYKVNNSDVEFLE